jgi:hypothetical protein
MKIGRMFSYFLLGTLIINLLYISQNLNQKSLWYDEAGQFFIAKGLNHDSEPFEKEKDLMQVIENNANYNLDPGGFSILLHFWVKVSNSSIWLRLLPFIFFIGFILSWIYLFFYWFKNWNIAILSAFIPLIFRSSYIALAFEIRAYSMEYLGTILCVIALINLKLEITNSKLFIWSCVFSFFITSRYSEVIVVFIASLIIIYYIFLSKLSLKRKIFSLLIYAFPLIITVLYIIFAAQIVQNKSMVELDYVYYISRDFKELITLRNILFLIVIISLFVLYIFRNKYSFIKKYETLLLFTVSINLVFIALSYFGIYPWSPEDQRCISLYLLVNLSGFAILGELLFNKMIYFGNIKYYFTYIGLIAFIFFRRESFFTRQHLENRENYHEVLTTLDLKKYNKIFVESRLSAPSIRYLFEYGALKSRKNLGYPNKFTFGKFVKHNIVKGAETESEYFASQPKMNSYLQYDLLITPKLHSYGDNDKWVLLNGTKGFYIKKKK